MKREGEQLLLRVWVRSTDRCGLLSAAEGIVEAAQEMGLAGGTVLRGIYGLDGTGKILASHWWSPTVHLPVVVEIIDQPAAIGSFLPRLATTIDEGLATLERAHVLVFRRGPGSSNAFPDALPVDLPDLSLLPSAEEFPVMKESERGELLRVFLGESDTWEGKPLYQAIIEKARELGIAGATVFRGAAGFGANSRVHSTKLAELSTDLPIVVEIVDSTEQLERILPFLDDCLKEGLMTIEAVQILRYRHNPSKQR